VLIGCLTHEIVVCPSKEEQCRTRHSVPWKSAFYTQSLRVAANVYARLVTPVDPVNYQAVSVWILPLPSCVFLSPSGVSNLDDARLEEEREENRRMPKPSKLEMLRNGVSGGFGAGEVLTFVTCSGIRPNCTVSPLQ
jgi:hypothetical protein